MAAVILPLLPEGPFGPYGAVKPRLLWALVLFFSGFSFVGYVIERVAGPGRGYVIAGTLGGLLSSTSVTLTFARLSRSREASAAALAAGAIGASVVLLPRLIVTTAVLAPAMTASLWPRFVIPAVIGAAFVLRGWKADARASVRASDRNPLQFASALQMAALFQAVLFAVAFVTAEFGQRGIYASAAVLGLADMDALTVSMAQLHDIGNAGGHDRPRRDHRRHLQHVRQAGYRTGRRPRRLPLICRSRTRCDGPRSWGIALLAVIGRWIPECTRLCHRGCFYTDF